MKFMFKGQPFSGVATALVTPFDENGIINEQQLKDLINWQLGCGIKGFLLMGGSGEYNALTMEERVHAVKVAVEAAAGRAPIIVGVLEPGIGEAVKAAKLFKEAGADIPLVLTPYYYTPTQEGVYDFFKKFDGGFNAPFLIYNIPYKNKTDVKPATFARIVEDIPNCCGLKECSPVFSDCIDIIHRVGDKCTVMSGEDYMMCGHVFFGAEAAIIASANLIPAEWARAFENSRHCDVEAAKAFYEKYFQLFDALFAEVNPGPMKYALRKIGMPVGEVSTPLVPCSPQVRAQLDELIAKLDIKK